MKITMTLEGGPHPMISCGGLYRHVRRAIEAADGPDPHAARPHLAQLANDAQRILDDSEHVTPATAALEGLVAFLHSEPRNVCRAVDVAAALVDTAYRSAADAAENVRRVA